MGDSPIAESKYPFQRPMKLLDVEFLLVITIPHPSAFQLHPTPRKPRVHLPQATEMTIFSKVFNVEIITKAQSIIFNSNHESPRRCVLNRISKMKPWRGAKRY